MNHGYVFMSETNGTPLKAQTLSQEMYVLAKIAGIEEKAHARMFRHRFITKLFVALIEQHTFDTVDDFRRALLDTESMKQKVQQWTGPSASYNQALITTSSADLVLTHTIVHSTAEIESGLSPGAYKKAKNHSCPTRASLFYYFYDCEIKTTVLRRDSSADDPRPTVSNHQVVF